MVMGIIPVCVKCKATESPLWHKEEEQIICTDCKNLQHKAKLTESLENDKDEQSNSSKEDKLMEVDEIRDNEENGGKGRKEDDDKEKKDTRRKTRKGGKAGRGHVPKGKGRRYIFKKSATRAPAAVATPVTSQYLFYKGFYYQVGDIVSLVDIDGGTFYAQIRGLLQDQYCEKSAVLTWLLPTKNSPPPDERFDPSTYIIGPEEDIPRKLEFMDFVSHAPSDYFKDKTSPYATISYKPESCFVWSRIGPQIKPIERAKDLMTR